MWFAHLLTLSRLPLAAAFWAVAHRPPWAIAVAAIAAVTDLVDGPIARAVRRRAAARGQRLPPGPGSWLDPLCDKTFVVTALVATWVRLEPPLALVALIATRELILVPIALVYRLTPAVRRRLRYDFTAGPSGKAATVVQFLALAALLLGSAAAPALALAAAAVGLLAAAHYIGRGIRLARTSAPGPAAPG